VFFSDTKRNGWREDKDDEEDKEEDRSGRVGLVTFLAGSQTQQKALDVDVLVLLC
jgi:hypothetical protein